jgi:hypothetical protein
LTPASTTPAGSDVDGAPFKEDWEYAYLVGMLMYLEANTRPDIEYAVHQAARYTHDPKASHAVAIKRILRYIKGNKDNGINKIKPAWQGCWSHGYQVAKSHTSLTCNMKKSGHQDAATKINTMVGLQWGKE